MDERSLFEEYESQDEHVGDLESALRESHGRLSSLHDRVKRLLQTKYAGKAVYGATKFYLLDDAGNVIAREPAVADGQALPEPVIDAIMGADWNPPSHQCENPVSYPECLLDDIQPRFGFNGGRPRAARVVDGRRLYLGFSGSDSECVIQNGEVS